MFYIRPPYVLGLLPTADALRIIADEVCRLRCLPTCKQCIIVSHRNIFPGSRALWFPCGDSGTVSSDYAPPPPHTHTHTHTSVWWRWLADVPSCRVGSGVFTRRMGTLPNEPLGVFTDERHDERVLLAYNWRSDQKWSVCSRLELDMQTPHVILGESSTLLISPYSQSLLSPLNDIAFQMIVYKGCGFLNGLFKYKRNG